MLSVTKKSLLNIKTSDILRFLNKWIAIVSVVVTFIVLILAVSRLLVDEYKPPLDVRASSPNTTTRVSKSDNTILNNYWYFNGIGINNPSTNFAGHGTITPTDVAQKCMLFGNDCLGFDTLGSLFLSRDRNITTLKGLDTKYKGGLYVLTDSKQAETVCQQFGGDLNKLNKVCNNFETSAINSYPFPFN